MKIAILGNPNAGKTWLKEHLYGALHLPIFFLRIACCRKDRDKFWKFDSYAELFLRQDFIIREGYNGHKGEKKLIVNLCEGKEEYEQEIDYKLLEFMVSNIYRLWKEDSSIIVAEGEFLAKKEWLKIVDPDRIYLVLINSKYGLVKRNRKGREHPEGWTEKKYFEHQKYLLEYCNGWIEENRQESNKK